jgi:hypothetical protein
LFSNFTPSPPPATTPPRGRNSSLLPLGSCHKPERQQMVCDCEVN